MSPDTDITEKLKTIGQKMRKRFLAFLAGLLSLGATFLHAEPKVRVKVSSQAGVAPLELGILVNATGVLPEHEQLILIILQGGGEGEDATVIYKSEMDLPGLQTVRVQLTTPSPAFMERVWTLATSGDYVVAACLAGRRTEDVCTAVEVVVQ